MVLVASGAGAAPLYDGKGDAPGGAVKIFDDWEATMPTPRKAKRKFAGVGRSQPARAGDVV